jgi:hypothetical protein
MEHRKRNLYSTERTMTAKNIVHEKSGRWYVHIKVYGESEEECVMYRAKIIDFINGLICRPCNAESNAILSCSAGDELGYVARDAPQG